MWLESDIPKVAIIGRPNVGKSTLFNILTNTRKSVVKNQPGVTRDIIIEPCEIWGKHFDLIDTGGITESNDVFSKLIREQVTEFIQTVDLLIVVLDGRAGMVPEDQEIIKLAEQSGKPFLLVVNKVDRASEEELLKADFYVFGRDLVATSFEQRQGLASVLEWLFQHLPEKSEVLKEGLTISIVGKPNVGKSSLCNAILGEQRMLVSDQVGTTVDSVDTPFVYNNKKYILIDTAGLRKSAKRHEDIEIISAFKSQESIRRSDVVLLTIDGVTGPTEQDAKIMEIVLEKHKAIIVVANKIDLPEFSKKNFADQCERVFHFYTDVPVVYVSSLKGYGLRDLFEKIEWMRKKLETRISTSELNQFFFETIRKAPSPVWGTGNVKFYYLTQTYQRPPAFIAFANHPQGVDNSYRRFLIKNLKDKFDLSGLPIRIFVMSSRGNQKNV